MNVRRTVFVVVLALGFLAGVLAPAPVAATSMPGTWWGWSGGWYGSNPIQPFLIIDALPVDAQVYLDGRLLGNARDLIARALPIAPGRHTIEVVAPGFASYTARFGTDPLGFSTRVQVTLLPQ